MVDEKDVNTQSWIIAQEGEIKFWKHIVENKEYLDVHAEDFKKEIPLFIEQLKISGFIPGINTNILQIGCALFDLIDFLPLGNKFAIEPLEEYFSSLNDHHRDHAVKRVTGKAEELPYENSTMDVIISHNMFDHVDSPTNVLQEMRRVIKEEGRIWIQVHTFSPISLIIKKMLLFLKIDTKHLFFWTANELLLLYSKMGLEPIFSSTVPDSGSLIDCAKAGEWRPILKKILLIAPKRMTAVLKPKITQEK